MHGPTAILDHLVLATPDLVETVGSVESAVGVRPSPGGQHLGRGTRNFLLSLGPGRYLEIIGADAEQPEPPHPRPFGIDGLEKPGLRAWAAKSANLEELVSIAARHDYDIGTVQEMSRKTPAGSVLRWRLTLRSGECVSVVPFFIDWGASVHPATTAAAGASLLRFEGRHPDPQSIRLLLAALGVELPVEAGPESSLVAEIAGPRGVMRIS